MIDREPPPLSIVITATDSDRAVQQALDSLEGQVEILVVSTRENGKGSTVPRLRRIGLEAAKGRVVAFLEDSCRAGPGWADAWIKAFSDPSLVAGSGLVEHDDPDASPLDRSVVFCEYAPFLPPGPAGRPTRLAGNNFAVLRQVALENSTDELHETELLDAIRGEVRTVKSAVVHHVRRFSPREAFGDRFRFGLEYGGRRTLGAPAWFRWAGLIAGPAIFTAQVIRLSATLLKNRRYRGQFLTTLPITLALLAAWSLGEWMGWSLGKPHERAARTVGRTSGRLGSPRLGYKSNRPLA